MKLLLFIIPFFNLFAQSRARIDSLYYTVIAPTYKSKDYIQNASNPAIYASLELGLREFIKEYKKTNKLI